jgi:predicted permease
MERLFREIDERIQHAVGARMVAPALYAPMTGDSWNEGVRIAGRPEPPAKEDTGAGYARVMPGFFETIGARMVQGRAFGEQDTGTSRNVAVVNEAFARRFFKGQSAIGQHFGVNKIKYASKMEIVGVVRDMRYMTYDYKDPVRPMFWLPETQTVSYEDADYQAGEIWSHYLYNIVIWAPGNQAGMEERVRKVLASIDPTLVLYSVDPYSKVLSGNFQQENMIAKLTMLFGVLGLVLATVGLYGVMAYSVEQRTGEIGLRMALGADRAGVVGMVLGGAFWQVGIGLVIGIPAAIGIGRLMTDQLFGVQPSDPVMLMAATVLLCVAAVVACLIPATRAASVQPMVALRNE